MRIPIISNHILDDYLTILKDYHFVAMDYVGYKVYEHVNPVSKGTIEIQALEDLFDISKRLHEYHKANQCKDDDLLIIRYGFLLIGNI
jgi:hypothetical protein